MACGGLDKNMDFAAEVGRNLVIKNSIQPEYGDERLTRDGTTESIQIKIVYNKNTTFSGANGDREMFIFPV